MGRPNRNFEIGVPYHIAHRGNQQMTLFESDTDRRYYLAMLGSFARRHGVRIGGFCLMDNHVHLAVVPDGVKAISRCFGQLHKRYSEMLNSRRGRRGCCWDGRLYAGRMDSRHAYNALRYIERNPVQAGMVGKATDWMWSSARMHCGFPEEWDFVTTDVRSGWIPPEAWRKALGAELTEEELATIEWNAVEQGMNARMLLAVDRG